MRSKVTVVGAGNVGATAAQRIFDKGYADVALVDIVEGLPQGKALDMLESGPVIGTDAKIIGTNSYDETADSDVVVITSGIARRPGMSRDDLLLTNMKIVTSVVNEVASRSPNALLLIVTNPLDAMAQQAFQVSGFPKHRVFGMAGILDTARFRTFLAEELNVSVNSIEAYVLGGHGDTMVPITGRNTVGGTPIGKLLSKERVHAIVQRTKDGGAEIVNLLKTGSAYYAPSASIAQMDPGWRTIKGSHWIWIRESATLEEAKTGSQNKFRVQFDIPPGKQESIIRAELLLRSDDACHITVNDVGMNQEFGGSDYPDPFIIDIEKFIKDGENTISFELICFAKPNAEIPEDNRTGLIYRLHIEYRE